MGKGGGIVCNSDCSHSSATKGVRLTCLSSWSTQVKCEGHFFLVCCMTPPSKAPRTQLSLTIDIPGGARVRKVMACPEAGKWKLKAGPTNNYLHTHFTLLVTKTLYTAIIVLNKKSKKTLQHNYFFIIWH